MSDLLPVMDIIGGAIQFDCVFTFLSSAGLNYSSEVVCVIWASNCKQYCCWIWIWTVTVAVCAIPFHLLILPFGDEEEDGRCNAILFRFDAFVAKSFGKVRITSIWQICCCINPIKSTKYTYISYHVVVGCISHKEKQKSSANALNYPVWNRHITYFRLLCTAHSFSASRCLSLYEWMCVWILHRAVCRVCAIYYVHAWYGWCTCAYEHDLFNTYT